GNPPYLPAISGSSSITANIGGPNCACGIGPPSSDSGGGQCGGGQLPTAKACTMGYGAGLAGYPCGPGASLLGGALEPPLCCPFDARPNVQPPAGGPNPPMVPGSESANSNVAYTSWTPPASSAGNIYITCHETGVTLQPPCGGATFYFPTSGTYTFTT